MPELSTTTTNKSTSPHYPNDAYDLAKSTTDAERTLPGRCHCGRNMFSVILPPPRDTGSRRISTDLCHCTTCKHTSGQLACVHVSILGKPLRRSTVGEGVRGRKLMHGESGQRTPLGSREHSPLTGASSVITVDSRLQRSSLPDVTEGAIGTPEADLQSPGITINIIRVESEDGSDSDEGDGYTKLPSPSLWKEEGVDSCSETFDLSQLRSYSSSDGVQRHFCIGCSAQLFWVDSRPREGSAETERWAVAVGALQNPSKLVHVGYHIHIADTLDGGLADHLRMVDGVHLPRYAHEAVVGDDSEVAIGWRETKTKVDDNTPMDDHLNGFCHCGSNRFRITRPSESAGSFDFSSPYPDLLHPFNSARLSTLRNPRDEKWWIRPPYDKNGQGRYLAGHCMCTFCRLSSGMEIQSWAYVPLANIEISKGVSLSEPKPLELDPHSANRPSSLSSYSSSPGRYREFCKTCGATMFLWQASLPELILVSVGVLDEVQGRGARCENWLDWHGDRVSFVEKSEGQGMEGTGKGLAAGIRAWTAELHNSTGYE